MYVCMIFFFFSLNVQLWNQTLVSKYKLLWELQRKNDFTELSVCNSDLQMTEISEDLHEYVP